MKRMSWHPRHMNSCHYVSDLVTSNQSLWHTQGGSENSTQRRRLYRLFLSLQHTPCVHFTHNSMKVYQQTLLTCLTCKIHHRNHLGKSLQARLHSLYKVGNSMVVLKLIYVIASISLSMDT